MKTLIVGLGNPDRGDDAAGLLVARKLGGVEHTGDMLSLMEIWSGYEHVIVIDAMVSGAPPGTVRLFDEPPRGLFHSLAHEFGLAEVVELARSLGRLPPKLTIYGIEAVNCEPGRPVSAEVSKAILDTYQLVMQTSR